MIIIRGGDDKDFENFQENFIKYQQRFGLSGWQVYFKHEPLEKVFATVTFRLVDMVATVRLNSKLQDKDIPFKGVKRNTKHEALHLLVGRLEQIAESRYTSADEIYEAAEELVNKLDGLISDD